MTFPVYHHPCGRREVVVAGKWGHMLAHPANCPDCYPHPDSPLGRAITKTRQRIENVFKGTPDDH